MKQTKVFCNLCEKEIKFMSPDSRRFEVEVNPERESICTVVQLHFSASKLGNSLDYDICRECRAKLLKEIIGEGEE